MEWYTLEIEFVDGPNIVVRDISANTLRAIAALFKDRLNVERMFLFNQDSQLYQVWNGTTQQWEGAN